MTTRYTPATKQVESWTTATKQSETWTDGTTQSETWTKTYLPFVLLQRDGISAVFLRDGASSLLLGHQIA